MKKVMEMDEQLIWDIVKSEAEVWIGENDYPKLKAYLAAGEPMPNDVSDVAR